ncbi:unnamed protein product [Didymodactylos carnosus]|uniref:Fanconi anemia core complex-associated protein 24 pseudonuclease domain-containing protein n=1 Tax=Didymodactylos carnosus TaxID=1234261 RepID=A0A8S2VAS1_9BILA|nr:unnamed protein product [Didymodactylos carnosus]CAF4389428.1 unnamed protein product [Didymodactylos carnosus]
MSILKVPASTIFVSSTWRASNIYDKLKQMNVKVVVEDNMLFDFQIRNRCILYATKERQQGEQFREQIGSCSFKVIIICYSSYLNLK